VLGDYAKRLFGSLKWGHQSGVFAAQFVCILGRLLAKKEPPMPAALTGATTKISSLPEGSPQVVCARGLVKTYGDRNVVDGLDFEVYRGECLGLLGPNGAGKTTTLRMVLGLTYPSQGELEVLGWQIPEQARQMRRRVGVVPQADNLDPDFTVRENLVTFAKYFGLSGAGLSRKIDELLEFSALTGRQDAAINALSGGMKRRLTLARALINDPNLVVLDEPTTGLDPQARQHIWQRLHGLLQQECTLILTTHDMGEAQRLCTRVAIIDHGKVVDCDTPRGLIERHIEPHVAELVGDMAEQWQGEAAGVRCERIGETVLLYARDREALISALASRPALAYLYRPANLEDVFLAVTGRELRD